MKLRRKTKTTNMMKHITIKKIMMAGVPAAMSLALLAGAAGQMPEAMDTDVMTVAETNEEDNDALVSQQLADKVTESYKQLKFVQYEGVTEDQLYPMVMNVRNDVLAAMDAPKPLPDDVTRFKGILLDLAPLLMKASQYYSAQSQPEKMSEYARAYVDTRIDPRMADINFGTSADAVYPTMVYIAASSAYNAQDFAKAIDYFNAYLATKATDRREQVAMFLGQACLKENTPEKGIDRLLEAVNVYPANLQLLMITLQNCIDGGYSDNMQPLLDRALALKPGDEQLLALQARLYENDNNWNDALGIYQQLYDLRPNSMSVNQHLALCYYNLGADYYNRALMESDEKLSKKYSRQSNAYFSSAADKLNVVVENDPTNTKYLRALAVSYGCLGNKERLDEVNLRLSALGIAPMAMNGMPESIVFGDNAKKENTAQSQAVPDFQEFARGYVEMQLAEWSKRREFEKTEDFEKRVSQDNLYAEYQRLCKQAEADYLKKYAGRMRISDLQLEPYDIDNETYLINSAMGPIVVKVPLKNKEAEAFKSQWNSIKLRNPRYYIKDNRVAIASVELVTSAGKTYSYNSEKAADYDFTDVQLDVNSILAQNQRNNQSQAGGNVTAQKTNVIRAKSDVDQNIPVTSRRAEKTVALIMANENYKNVTAVSSALNDGETFAKYCTQTLGIPESQVMLYEDMTYAEMLSAVAKLRKLVAALGDGVDVIVYYAGHGFPDEGSKDAFLLPVDGDGFTTAASMPLKKFYSDLSAMHADNVMVFLDACFSGAARDGGMLAEARGVALKPREAAPEGNMFILSAASDQETALPYKEKNHGLFTYFLLKKIQETKGNVSLKDLSAYVEDQVKRNSLTVNSKMQTPRTSVSGNMANTWASKKLRP